MSDTARVQMRTVSEDEAGLRLDRWFQRHYPALTHGALQKLLRTGQVRLDGKRAEGKDRVEPGQAVRLPPGVTAPPPVAAPPPPQQVLVRAEPPPDAPASGRAGPTIASIASGSSQSGGSFYVQTGAFSTINNATRQRELISSYGSTEIFQASAGGHEVYRVRVGPYTTPDAAGIVADRLKRSGYGEARVVTD